MNLVDSLSTALAGRYEIVREIGRGGMATVYLARDIRHERNVALKVLSPELGAVLGAERFLSEIRVTANLQHPNLLPLFDSGEANGLLFYVMPFVEGESLRHRLDRERQLSIDEAVRIAVAIAGALDYAHQHGVIHRDLKPENILLQHGQPVVADFGIALAVSKAGGQRVTQTGLSLGTPQYMSPEQATGDRIIDARSDVYSLGAITYEMLAGEPPHTGSSAQAIISRLLTEEPRALTAARPSVPDHVDAAVRCALQKLPADRFASASAFALALDDRSGVMSTRARTPLPRDMRASRAHPVMRMLPWALAGTFALAAVWLARRDAMRSEPAATRFVLELPRDQRIALANGSSVTLSPDGRTVAYVATASNATANRIFVRRLDSLQARALPDGEGIAPIFSPNGREIAFRASGDLRRVSLGGGAADVITRLSDWQGFAWVRTGEILLAQGGRIWRVGDGGVRTPITTLDTASGERSHAAPWLLDDETIAFSVYRRTPAGERADVALVARSGGPHTRLNIDGQTPLGYVDGHILVSHPRGALVAYRVDLKQRRVTGRALALLDSVAYIPSGGLQLNLAPNGTLAYLQGSSGGKMTLLDVRGATLAETPDARDYAQATISPDGRRVAVRIEGEAGDPGARPSSDIWIWDIETKGLSRLTTDGGRSPAWTADGKSVAFLRGMKTKGTDIWLAPADGSGSPTLLRSVPEMLVSNVRLTPSGNAALLSVIGDAAASTDIYLLDLATPSSAPAALVHSRFREKSPAVSPDGRWLAYDSDETGKAEVYVTPLNSSGPRPRVSVGAGTLPQWASGGRRLIYSSGTHTIAATMDLSATATRVTRVDTLAFDGLRSDVDPRTDHILVTRESADRRIVIVLNWLAEVRAKLAAK